MSTKAELSNLSYTNKDFNSIYSELLEYAKKLSYKWDPTSSDESDPGVVLLKLAAIVGDKDNYNIDKNVLELMPASVTQLPAARQVFDQCGYSMQYYVSATGVVNLTIKEDLGDDLEEGEEYNYTIPQFTMFSDTDSNVVYTSIESVTIPIKTEAPIHVMEGTITQYSVNNDALITAQNLDSANRLYFTESNIAQNGIFITNVSSKDSNSVNYDEWHRVDNLQTQPKNSRCYKFGITIDGSVCYIEFPDDVELLIGEGLHISYILTSGADGNVSANRLKQLYVDTKFGRKANLSSETVQVDATAEKLYIRNNLPIINGEDPETIDEAYKNYKRIRDTFDTLVSLKDYSDYLVTSETASNGFVCDRTNDVQHSYKVLTTQENNTYLRNIVASRELKDVYKKNSNGTYEQITEPYMDAFDLCVYALEYAPTVTTTETYKSTFRIFDLNAYQNRTGIYFADEVKSLQHDYVEFEPDTILMLKNKYPIKASVIPRQPLSVTEKMQVVENIEKALYSALNSKQLYFGQSVSSELIQDTIITADERIKTLIDFSSPAYETYAVYKASSDGKFKELRIDAASPDGGFYIASIKKSEFDSVKGELFIKTLTGNAFYNAKDATYDAHTTYYMYDSDLHDLWRQFRTEIFAKNVLAGVTPLYTDANVYSIGVNQKNIVEYSDIAKISSNVLLSATINTGGGTEVSTCSLPTLKKNESILLSAPNFIKENNFSSYVKMLYYLPNLEPDKLFADEIYELKTGDYIIFFWKDSDVSEDYTYIKYDESSQSPAKYISPTGFNLNRTQDLTSTKYYDKDKININNIHNVFSKLPSGKGTTKSPISYTDFIVGETFTLSSFVNECLKSDSKNQVLTGTKIFNTLKVNTIRVNNKTNGCKYLYWILNNKNKDNKYVLFENDEDKYTLQSGEYFIYTNDAKSVLHLLGEGTVIERSSSYENDTWSVDAINYDDLITEGIDLLTNKWYTVVKSDNDSEVVLATEQQQILIGPQNTLQLTYEKNDKVIKSVVVDSAGTTVTFDDETTQSDLKNFTIAYIDADNNSTSITSIHSDVVYWSARSLYNLDLSSDEPQLLEDGQSITIHQSDDTEVTIQPNEDDSAVTYMMCSNNVQHIGGSNIKLEDMFNDTVGLLTYTVSESDVDDPYNVTNTFTKQLTKESDESTTSSFELSFEVLPGKYLIQIATSDPVSIKAENIGSNDTTTKSFNRLANSDNVYKLIIEGRTPVVINIKVTVTFVNNIENVIVTIPPLFRYSDDLLKSFRDNTSAAGNDKEDFETSLLNCMKSLDKKSEFNYAYRPSNPIYNPLYSEEFLKAKHVFNKYTICEWDAKMSEDKQDNIIVHDVVR